MRSAPLNREMFKLTVNYYDENQKNKLSLYRRFMDVTCASSAACATRIVNTNLLDPAETECNTETVAIYKEARIHYRFYCSFQII